MYFVNTDWRTLFTIEEAEKIKARLQNCMNFSPLQHAHDIGWIEGMKILINYKVGLNQGDALDKVDIPKFLKKIDKLIELNGY